MGDRNNNSGPRPFYLISNYFLSFLVTFTAIFAYIQMVSGEGHGERWMTVSKDSIVWLGGRQVFTPAMDADSSSFLGLPGRLSIRIPEDMGVGERCSEWDGWLLGLKPRPHTGTRVRAQSANGISQMPVGKMETERILMCRTGVG